MMGSYIIPKPILPVGAAPRARGYILKDDFARQALTPTGWPTIYTEAETGAGGSTTISTALNRILLTTDANAGDDQNLRTSGLRIDRDYCSLVTGMQNIIEIKTDAVQVNMPFSVDVAADGEAFLGLHANTSALTALPTTARHLGVYWDISAGANYMLTSSNGTTQVTVDTTVPVDTSIHILQINWTAENAATIKLMTAAGADEGTGATVTAFNLTSGNSHELHWFVQAEAGGAVVLTGYPWMVKWT